MTYHKNLKKIISLVIIIVLVFEADLFIYSQENNLVKKQFQEALGEYKRGQYNSSKQKLEDLIKNADKSPSEKEKKEILGKCYLLLGAISEKKGDTKAAEDYYQRAIGDSGIETVAEINLDELPAYKRVKITAQVEKDFIEARNKYTSNNSDISKAMLENILRTLSENRLELKSIQGSVYLLLGALYEKEGKLILSEENYRKAFETYEIKEVDGVDFSGLPSYRKISEIISIEKEFEKAKGEYISGHFRSSEEKVKNVISSITESGFDQELKNILGQCHLLLSAIYEKLGNTYLAEENYRIAKDEYNTGSIDGIDLSSLQGLHRFISGKIISQEAKSPRMKKNFLVLAVIAGVIIGAAAVLLLTKKKKSRLEFVTNVDTVNVPEGGTSTFQLKLSAKPSANVSVTVTRVDGDTDIYVQSDSPLTFTDSNWNQNQTITLAANEDIDILNGTSTFRISARDIGNKDIKAVAQDNDSLAFVTDTDSIAIAEGQTATLKIKFSNQPTSTIEAIVSRVSGDSDISVLSGSSLTFNASNWDIYQSVTLAAAEDADDLNGTATIRLSASGIQNKDVTATEIDKDDGIKITVSAPKAGDNLKRDVKYTIKWDTEGGSLNRVSIKVVWVLTGGGSESKYINQSAENDGSFNWVPDIISGQCQLIFERGYETKKKIGESGFFSVSN